MVRLPTTPLLLAVLAVCACAPTGTWQNADVPQEQWKQDQADCRRIAQQQAARDFSLTQNSGRSLDNARGGEWAAQMNTFSTGQSQDRFFASCMTQRGYTLQPEAEPGG